MAIYCTYLTVYYGNKMPMYYIGSSSVDKVLNGNYRGSVSSKMCGKIWKQELKYNPKLFKTKIITTHESRKEALDKEDFFHKKFKVMSNTMYVNRSRAIGLFGALECTNETRVKMSLASKGKPKSETHRVSIAKANLVKAKDPDFRAKLKVPKSKLHRTRISESLTGITFSEEHRNNISKSLVGKTCGSFSEERKLTISKALKGNHPNPNKGKTYDEIYGKQEAERLKKQRSDKMKEVLKNTPATICERCGISVNGRSNYFRYHGDNCKRV